jgi:response regulator RpfG family c-di-GMP phosphodiesterase
MSTQNELTSEITCMYLDDEMENRKFLQEKFEEKELVLFTPKSITTALSVATSSYSGVDIFICDYRLEELDINEDGCKLLLRVRESNPNIFLAIYTAFRNDIDKAGYLPQLSESDIYLYRKQEDIEVVMLDLEDDFFSFKRSREAATENVKVIQHEKYISESIEMALKQLEETPDEITVPIRKGKTITVQQLRIELEKGTDLAIKFLRDWIKTLDFIQKHAK